MSDEHLIMSRFENRVAKCKNPFDLDKLCRTYLEYRGKYNSQPMDPFAEAILQTNKDRPYISETFDIRKFSVTKAVDDFEWSRMDIKQQSEYEKHFEFEVVRDLGLECARAGFIKIDKEYCIATMRRMFKAQIEVKKPKETR